MKKMITFITAASLLMGSMVTPVYAVTFADIDTVTWSGFKPFLEEAAELKLMSGYDEGGKKLCKPRNNVTYCEAVQLMYSIMKVYTRQDVSDATVTKWKPIMSGYNIPDWAYKATAYALENSILVAQDLNKLQGNASKINTKPATREDVGVIFGKALDMINGYDVKTGASLSYADKGSVSAAAVPYLDLLSRAGLMVGDTDNKFNPKANISRAEMAVLSVKTYKKLLETKTEMPAEAVSVVGTVVTSMVMQNGDLFISLKTNAGDGLSLFGTKGKVTAEYDGDDIAFGDIGEGDTVKVSYKGTSLTAIEVTHSKAGIKKTTTETFELVDVTEKKVFVKDGSSKEEFHLDADVKVELNGSKTTVTKLRKALGNINYDVILTLDSAEYVLEMEVYINDDNPMQGYVEDVGDDEITIKVGSVEYTYPMAEDVEVTSGGKTMKFSKFENDYYDYNYHVSLEMNKYYEVDEIIVDSMEDEYHGTLTSLGSTKIRFTAGDEEYEYRLTDDVDVEVDGKSSTLDKLRDSFRDGVAYLVAIDVDRDDEVTEIIAETKFGGNSNGTLKDIDEDEVTVIVDNKYYTYDLAEEVDVTINGKGKDLDELIEYIAEYGFTVELKFDNVGDVKVITAELTEVTEGILRDIVDEDYITIRAADISIDLDLADEVDITLDGEEITLTKLNDQIDYSYRDSHIFVEVEYDRSGDVDEIKAYWEDVSGELMAVYDNDDEIKVGSKKYTMARRTDFVYKLATSVDKDDYRDVDDYDEDLDGLDRFMADCYDAGDNCIVTLTLDVDGDVTRIKATAK